MIRRWNHNVILFRGISRFLSAACRLWLPRQSGDRTCLVLKISRQLSVKGMSVQADGNSWKGRPKHISSLLYSTKHVRSPHWPGNHRLHTADKKREMPRNKMTLWFHLLIIMFVFIASLPKPNLRKRSRAPHGGALVCWIDDSSWESQLFGINGHKRDVFNWNQL